MCPRTRLSIPTYLYSMSLILDEDFCYQRIKISFAWKNYGSGIVLLLSITSSALQPLWRLQAVVSPWRCAANKMHGREGSSCHWRVDWRALSLVELQGGSCVAGETVVEWPCH